MGNSNLYNINKKGRGLSNYSSSKSNGGVTRETTELMILKFFFMTTLKNDNHVCELIITSMIIFYDRDNKSALASRLISNRVQ